MVLLEKGLHEFAKFLTVQETRLVSIEFSEELSNLLVEFSRVAGVRGKLVNVGGELAFLKIRCSKHI